MGIGKTFSVWYRRNFSNPEAVSLFLTLVFGLLFFELFGQFFMPVILLDLVQTHSFMQLMNE